MGKEKQQRKSKRQKRQPRSNTIKKTSIRGAKHSAFALRDYVYGQRLLCMGAMSAAPMGKDGAPNWPEPPNPMVA